MENRLNEDMVFDTSDSGKRKCIVHRISTKDDRAIGRILNGQEAISVTESFFEFDLTEEQINELRNCGISVAHTSGFGSDQLIHS